MNNFYRSYVKRFIDILISLILIFALLPLLVVSLPFVYFSNRGQVFFIQMRPGKSGKLFSLYKFKTMIDKYDEQGSLLQDKYRLTKTGRIIRSLSIDEIPQLINVLAGDMSLIGPRPLLPRYLSLYDENQMRRHEVRPGITGLAQINGRNKLNWNERLKLDVWYVDNYSFWLDVKILLLTVIKVIKREGVNSQKDTTMEPFKGNKSLL